MTKRWLALAALLVLGNADAEERAAILLRPAAVFDGVDGRRHAG